MVQKPTAVLCRNCHQHHILLGAEREGPWVITYAVKDGCGKCTATIVRQDVSAVLYVTDEEWTKIFVPLQKHAGTEAAHAGATVALAQAKLWPTSTADGVAMATLLQGALDSILDSKRRVKGEHQDPILRWVTEHWCCWFPRVDRARWFGLGVGAAVWFYTGERSTGGRVMTWAIRKVGRTAFYMVLDCLPPVVPTLCGLGVWLYFAPRGYTKLGYKREGPEAIEDEPEAPKEEAVPAPVVVPPRVEAPPGLEEVVLPPRGITSEDTSRVVGEAASTGTESQGAAARLAESACIETATKVGSSVFRDQGWDLTYLPASSAGETEGTKPLAIRTGPAGDPVQVWNDDVQTFELALEARYLEPARHRKYQACSLDRRKFGAIIAEMSKLAFTPERIEEWCNKNPTVKDRAAKAWTTKRVDQAYEQAYLKGWKGPQGSTKREVGLLQGGKKARRPRPIVCDGDTGMICASDTCGMLEYCMFKTFPLACIKYQPKDKAILKTAELLRMEHTPEGGDTVVMEGDGSAWDGSCSIKIRQAVENVFLRRAIELLLQTCSELTHPALIHAHMHACTDAFMKVAYVKTPADEERVSFTLEAIRRTGHRGTSILNWITNCVLTLAAVSSTVEEAREAVTCMYTGAGPIRCVFEGDDSIFCAKSKWWSAERETGYLALWTRAGFDMKIKKHEGKTAAEFCGWHIATDKHGCLPCAQPDVKRGVGHASWSHSPELMQAWRDGNSKKLRSLACGTYLSYARNFAGHNTVVATYFLYLARYYGKSTEAELSEDQKRKWGVEACQLEKDIMIAENSSDNPHFAVLLQQTGTAYTEEHVLEVVLSANLGPAGRVPSCWR